MLKGSHLVHRILIKVLAGVMAEVHLEEELMAEEEREALIRDKH